MNRRAITACGSSPGAIVILALGTAGIHLYTAVALSRLNPFVGLLNTLVQGRFFTMPPPQLKLLDVLGQAVLIVLLVTFEYRALTHLRRALAIVWIGYSLANIGAWFWARSLPVQAGLLFPAYLVLTMLLIAALAGHAALLWRSRWVRVSSGTEAAPRSISRPISSTSQTT